MGKYGEVDNPTTNIKDFKKGKFVKWLMYDTKPSFAVVSKVGKERMDIVHYEDGFPFCLPITPKYGGVREATREEALSHFDKIVDDFEKEFEKGGLNGALSARRQHYLNGVLKNLKEKGINPYTAIGTEVQDPMTCLYVLMGIYSGQGPSEHLEGLVSVPRFSEEKISKTMIKIKPDGFGKILSDVYNTPATSHGSLVAYWTYEVPKKAKGLVTNPKKLEKLNSNWVFSETFSLK